MAIVDDLNRLRDWLQAEVCDRVQLKAPDDEESAEAYAYKLVHPTAFIQYIPSSDRLPDGVPAQHPSLCIRLTEGEHRQDGTSRMQLMLHFGAWNPGLHVQDVLKPVGGNSLFGYIQATEGEYRRTADGWQDALSFVDRALRTLENAGSIDGLRVVVEDGIKYGMAGEDLEGFYPYWFAWVAFTVESGNVRARKIEEFL